MKAPVVAFDHLDDMHQAFLQQTSICLLAAYPAISLILQKRRATCSPGHHLLYDPAPANREELASGELIDLTPGLFQRRMPTGTALLLKAA